MADAQDLVIAKQGHFSVGRTNHTASGYGMTTVSLSVGYQVETGQSYRADHASWIQVPAHAKKLPLVYVQWLWWLWGMLANDTRWAGWFRYSHVTPGI